MYKPASSKLDLGGRREPNLHPALRRRMAHDGRDRLRDRVSLVRLALNRHNTLRRVLWRPPNSVRAWLWRELWLEQLGVVKPEVLSKVVGGDNLWTLSTQSVQWRCLPDGSDKLLSEHVLDVLGRSKVLRAYLRLSAHSAHTSPRWCAPAL